MAKGKTTKTGKPSVKTRIRRAPSAARAKPAKPAAAKPIRAEIKPAPPVEEKVAPKPVLPEIKEPAKPAPPAEEKRVIHPVPLFEKPAFKPVQPAETKAYIRPIRPPEHKNISKVALFQARAKSGEGKRAPAAEEKPPSRAKGEVDISVSIGRLAEKLQKQRAAASVPTITARGAGIREAISRRGNVVKAYVLTVDDIDGTVEITNDPSEMAGRYLLDTPVLDYATAALYDDIKDDLLKKVLITTEEAVDIKLFEALKQKFRDLAVKMAIDRIPTLTDDQARFISGYMVQEMLGLGRMEFPLKDDAIEEICVNNAAQPVWVYHREFGWLLSDIVVPNQMQIQNYSAAIARRIGRQITTQSPVLDAYLPTGDRVNATLMPISLNSNTITIRKFARKPWTITDFIKLKTMSKELVAFLWLAIQYESSMLISGGTASGKTSALNVLSACIPANQRVISIEQTPEVELPSYQQWVPMVVREATIEGIGAVNMLELLLNSLRMRPDRMIVGEIRRTDEAIALFEAIHTGNSVYSTMHAETVSETIRRLVSPPIQLPPIMLESLPLVLTMFRDRRSGIRRVFEVGELIPSEKENEIPTVNMLFRWNARTDTIEKVNESIRVRNMLNRFTSMSDEDITRTVADREKVIDWMIRKNIDTTEEVGRVIAQYYRDPKSLMKTVME